MKLKKRILSTILVTSILAIVSVVPVLAGEYKYSSTTASKNGHSSFEDDWTDIATIKVDGKYYDFEYGYDTWFVNEDFIQHVEAQKDCGKTYYGKIKNSKGNTDVTNKKSGTSVTGNADIKHTGKSVTYYVYARD